MTMISLNVSSIAFIFFFAVVRCAHSVDYKDLQALGKTCPGRDRCQGYSNKLNYTQRNCECDSQCRTYDDCCVDVRKRGSGQAAPATDITCLNVGTNFYSGIHVVSKCSNSWNGPQQIREKCEGPFDPSDPIASAPAVSVSKKVSYKNLFCAQCNNADMESLTILQMRLSCEESNLTQKQVLDKISYDEERKAWGVDRLDAQDGSKFAECKINYEVPSSLEKSVRFCRANLISKCTRDWTRHQVRRACEEYMAVVFDKRHAYRNPHCAMCNHKTMSELKCTEDLSSKKELLPLTALLSPQESSSTTPACPSKSIYDPFVKTCRSLRCAFKGFVIKDGKCVLSG